MACSVGWWRTVRTRIPEMFIGREGYDAVWKALAHESGFRPLDTIACYHETHRSLFGPGEILQGEEQVHNRRVVAEFFRANGLSGLLQCRPDQPYPLVRDF